MANRSSKNSSGCSGGMALFIIFSFLTNLYVILMFHRITGGQQGIDFSESFGIAPPSSHRHRHRHRLQEGSGDDDDAVGNKSHELQAKVQSLQDQLAKEEKGHHDEIQALKAKLSRQEEEVRKANSRFEKEVKSLREGGLQKQTKKKTQHKQSELLQDSLKADSMESQNENNNEGGIDAMENQTKNDDEEKQPQVSLRGKRHQQREQQRKQKQIIQSASSTSNVWPKPKNWEKMGFYDTRHHFNCKEHAHDQTKPLPSLEDWNFLRRQYEQIVDPNANFDKDPIPPTDGYTLEKDKEGPPPFHAALTKDGRGRGLFASRDIKKGELVLNGDQSDFEFPDAKAWRTFIFSLPRKKACDMIDWTWTQKTEKKGPFKIFSAMNISVLLNGGGDDEINAMPKSEISSVMYATKDIKQGEQLLTDYEIYDTVWDKVGL